MADKNDGFVIAPWKPNYGKIGHANKYFALGYVVEGHITILYTTTANITTANISNLNTPAVVLPRRSRFLWKDVNEIYIDSGCYFHKGTTNQNVYWDSQLTYQFSSLTVSDWSYLYIDDSSVVSAGTNLLTASEFIDSTTEPSWSDTKQGWYFPNGM